MGANKYIQQLQNTSEKISFKQTWDHEDVKNIVGLLC